MARAPACHWFCLGSAILALLTSCSRPEAKEEGVPIVISESWDIEALPPSIGDYDGDPDQLLFRPNDPLLIGRYIAVANAYEEIRIYRRDGRLVRRIGRRGEGPGEFRQLGGIRRVDDSLLAALDGPSRRITYFDLLGNVRKVVSVPFSIDRSAGWALLSADRILGLRYTIPETTPPGPRAARDTTDLVLFSSSGETVRTIRDIPGRSSLITPLSTWKGLPFAPSTRLDGSSEGLILSTGTRLLVYDGDFRVRSSLRMTRRLETTGELIRAHAEETRSRREALYGQPYRGELYPEGYEDIVPRYVPSFDRLRIDDDGCIWTSRYRLPGDSAISWMIIDPSTGRGASLEVPANWKLSDVRGDEIVGIATDSMGVSTIAMFRVRRPDSGSVDC